VAWPRPGEFTFSAGIADSQDVPDGMTSLLKAADDALLSAKRLGRNRVLLHEGGRRAAA
jgi:PleD family two-component response regulator